MADIFCIKPIHGHKVCVGRVKVNERKLMQSRAKQMFLIISKICLTNFSHSVHNTSHPLYAKPCNWRYSKKIIGLHSIWKFKKRSMIVF